MTAVVVGVDGSPGSDLAVAFAAEEARLRDLPLRVVCAWEAPALEYAGAAFIPAEDLWNQAEQRAAEVVRTAVALASAEPGLAVEGLAVEGHAAKVLAERGRGAALLVVGSRGHSGFAGVVLGSVGDAPAHHPPCPLVIVPGDGA